MDNGERLEKLNSHHTDSVGNKTFRENKLISSTEIFNFQFSTFNSLVVFSVRRDFERAVDLLAQNHPRELVGKGHLAH